MGTETSHPQGFEKSTRKDWDNCAKDVESLSPLLCDVLLPPCAGNVTCFGPETIGGTLHDPTAWQTDYLLESTLRHPTLVLSFCIFSSWDTPLCLISGTVHIYCMEGYRKDWKERRGFSLQNDITRQQPLAAVHFLVSYNHTRTSTLMRSREDTFMLLIYP